MEAVNELSQVRKYEITKMGEIVEYVAVSILAIAIPLFLQGPQLLVGSVVNAALIMGAINVKGFKKLVPLIILPSIAALMGGLLFAEITPALFYMLPFIWLGNASLVYNIKNRHIKKKNKYLATLGFAATNKTLIIGGGALVLTLLGVVPAKFLILMGVFQLITALIGGLLVIPTNMLYKKYSK